MNQTDAALAQQIAAEETQTIQAEETAEVVDRRATDAAVLARETANVASPTWPGAPFTQPLEVISSENAGRLRELAHSEQGWVTGFLWAPDGKTIALTMLRGIALYTADTFVEIQRLELDADVWTFTFSPDGLELAFATENGRVELWNVRTLERRLLVQSESQGSADRLAFSSDGTLLAISWAQRNVELWDVAAGQEIKIFSVETLVVCGLAFSPDGTTLAVGGSLGGLWLVNMTTGEVGSSIKGLQDYICGLSFSPDGQLLAVAAPRDGMVGLWSVATREPLWTDHLNWVYGFSLAPDASLLAAGDVKGTVQLWDAISGQQVGQLQGRGNYLRSLAFSPDGKLLATAAPEEGTVRLWAVWAEP